MAAPQPATTTTPTPTEMANSNADQAVPAASSASSSSSSSSNKKVPANPTHEITAEGKERYQQFLIDQAVTRDWYHYASLRDAQDRTESKIKAQHIKIQEFKSVQSNQRVFDRNRLYGQGYNGFGNGHTDLGVADSRILYPEAKARPGKRTAPPLKWSRKDLKEQAEQHEELVPIRLDVDWDKYKLRDTFTWNLHDRVIPVEVFAAQLVEDMGIKHPAAQPVYDQVVHQIHEQIGDFYPFAFSAEDALDPELPYSAYKNDEMRILIKLNITIGAHTLVDQFEWDINNIDNEPEKFATVMAEELSLSGEFKTAIAHCIREQSQLFTKSLYTIGHPFDGRPIEDPDLLQAMLPSPLPSVFRPQQHAKEYGPFLYELSDADLERNEVIFSREQRRQKRSVNRRGGPVLPDLKERQRTIRTLIVSSVLPGAATGIEDSRLFKGVAGAAAVTGRRGRAARDGEISDSEDSDDSMPDSPAMSQLQGTARTRGMRGAASVAHQRMAHFGRSETPEASSVHHHEPRTARRHGREREDTEEPAHLWVTLKIPKERLKRVLRDQRGRRALSRSETPARTPSVAPGSMGPPSTPGRSVAAAAAAATPKSTPAVLPPAIQNPGRLPAPPPPPPGQPMPTPQPPPPKWLADCLRDMLKSWPDDNFEGTMKYCAVDIDKDQVVSEVPNPLPKNISYMFIPRIRCHDCPGKLYNPGPGLTIEKFRVHLTNNRHRQKVTMRVGEREGSEAGDGDGYLGREGNQPRQDKEPRRGLLNLSFNEARKSGTFGDSARGTNRRLVGLTSSPSKQGRYSLRRRIISPEKEHPKTKIGLNSGRVREKTLRVTLEAGSLVPDMASLGHDGSEDDAEGDEEDYVIGTPLPLPIHSTTSPFLFDPYQRAGPPPFAPPQNIGISSVQNNTRDPVNPQPSHNPWLPFPISMQPGALTFSETDPTPIPLSSIQLAEIAPVSRHERAMTAFDHRGNIENQIGFRRTSQSFCRQQQEQASLPRRPRRPLFSRRTPASTQTAPSPITANILPDRFGKWGSKSSLQPIHHSYQPIQPSLAVRLPNVSPVLQSDRRSYPSSFGRGISPLPSFQGNSNDPISDTENLGGNIRRREGPLHGSMDHNTPTPRLRNNMSASGSTALIPTKSTATNTPSTRPGSGYSSRRTATAITHPTEPKGNDRGGPASDEHKKWTEAQETDAGSLIALLT
ncbi:hypothetical protein MKZ38_007295 [Zalerion maritima]|uniref:Uncharacterized protein n=1 Tax=Zalerion maritima TaxID=339359 RepID=A0AAD5RHZ4_9PEZI|nr:hypothetical protein MKZ38_007295 [Zalerion maritima]